MSSRYVRVVQRFEGFVLNETEQYISVGDPGDSMIGQTFDKRRVTIEEVDLPPQPSWWPPQAGDLLIEGDSMTPDAFYLVGRNGNAVAFDGLLDGAELEKKAREGAIRLSFRRGEGLAR